MKREYIRFEELLKKENHLKRMREQGFKLLYRRNRFKVFCGVGCLVVAVIPNGTGFFMLPLGLMLLGLSLKDLENFKENLKFKIWLRFNK